MRSARRILQRTFSQAHHRRRVYYSSVPETVVIKAADGLDDLYFPEYDPTPYDGGYDIAATYGQPLPSSEAICYPPSHQDPSSSTLKGFSYGSVPSPYGKEGADHGPPKTSRGVAADSSPALEKRPPSHAEDGNSPTNGFRDVDCSEDESYAWEDSKWKTQPSGEDGCSCPAEVRGDSFFSWIFPAQEDENRYRPRCADEKQSADPWKGVADYFFGFSYPGIDSRDEIYGYRNSIYGYEKKHSHEQRIHGHVGYWSGSKNTGIVPSFYEDYQEEEYPQSKYESTNTFPIYDEDYREKKEYAPSKHTAAEIVPIYYEDYQEEEEGYSQSKDVTTDIVPAYYEDYQEEEYAQSKYASTNSVPIHFEDYQENEEYAPAKGNGTEIVPFYYEDYQEEEDYSQSNHVTSDIVLPYYEDYQEEEYI